MTGHPIRQTIKATAAVLLLVGLEPLAVAVSETRSEISPPVEVCHLDFMAAVDRLNNPPAVRRPFDSGNDAWLNRDYDTAVTWWQKGADEGDMCSQFQLGDYYKVKNYPLAAKWLRKAADQGHAESQSDLGILYYRGLGVAQDKRVAASWFRKAADHGYVDAQYWLGIMYFKGEGVPQDYVLAHMWFNLAAAAGEIFSADAAISRERAAALMSPAQIAEAQKLAREWKPK